MSAQPENRFIASIHKLMPKEIHREKMHNMYRGGTPDVYYSGCGGDLWIEYKFIPRVPQRGEVVANLSELQKLWLKGRHLEGRKVHVIVGCPAGGVILSKLDWESPLSVSDFSNNLQSKQAIADWITQATGGTPHGNSIRKGYLPETRKAPKRSQGTNYLR